MFESKREKERVEGKSRHSGMSVKEVLGSGYDGKCFLLTS